MGTSSNAPAATLASQEAGEGGRAAGARYLMLEQLASGGMGTVHRVRDTATGEQLVMKRMRAEFATRKIMRDAFEREFQVLSSLAHPRIIRVFDYGVDELGPYYTMEKLDGDDLSKAAPVPYREACRYLRDVATSLALLHARRLIHRDLSPSNVRKTRDGYCKLLDFGALMPFGTPTAIVGTAPGVPPEALDGSALDQRVDCYALGALSYYLLTGRHAYPARQIVELAELWKTRPAAPSSWVAGIPPELDQLVLSMLSLDRMARPENVAEVIARLNTIADLPEEESGHQGQLAQSFLLNPHFTGRSEELTELQRRAQAAAEKGQGSAAFIEAASGMGRTRLLEELVVHAKLLGMTVLHVDASMCRSSRGVARALAVQLLDVAPELSRRYAGLFQAALRLLGDEVGERLRDLPPPSRRASQDSEATGALEHWFVEVSREKALAVLVDNAECADDASLGLLASLAKCTGKAPLCFVAVLRTHQAGSVGISAIKAYATRIEIPALSPEEVFELVVSMFGDVPNARRFAEWLYGRTLGGPMHALEIVRQLVAKRVVRYQGGIWTLPVDRPEVELPTALEDALSMRLSLIGPEARALAECISLQREQPTLELCRAIAKEFTERPVLLLLDELAQQNVFYIQQGSYRFSSLALRDTLLSSMDSVRLGHNHRRLGRALARLLREDDPVSQIEAGWHLMQGGDELRGAEMVAHVCSDPTTIRVLLVNLYRAGNVLDAALKVYNKYRRSIYERAPILTALTQSGYYEDRCWGELHGDAALDVLEHLSGLGLVRRIRPYLGSFLGLVVGLSFAVARFYCVPRRERRYSFHHVIVYLMTAVTTLAGTAALSLDVERTRQVAKVLEPFATLPDRLTPVGIYQFCMGLSEIGRDNEAVASATFQRLLSRFEDRTYYRALPDGVRQMYIAAVHFARASFAIFKAHGEDAVQSADALDRTGFRLYAMIASQLRFLYHINRGEFDKAELHHELVELHAAHVGSAWQVETWEAPALILVHTALGDIVNSTRVAQRLEVLSREVFSLRHYYELALHGVLGCRNDPQYTAIASEQYRDEAPRSYIGWGAVRAFLARGYNQRGQHHEAREVCEAALSCLGDEDLEYVSHFLELELQCALADAGLGNIDPALARLDQLIARFKDCDHALLQGRLHETRARVCFSADRLAEYRSSLAEVARWFSPTAASVLVARYQRLAELDPQSSEAQARVRELGRRRPSLVPTAVSGAVRRPLPLGSVHGDVPHAGDTEVVDEV